MIRTHHGQHSDCFGCKLRTLQYSGRPPSPQTVMESAWSRDMAAYHRLRMNGLQPPHIDGCAEIEASADTQIEVEMRGVLTNLTAQTGQTVKQLVPKITEGLAITRDSDWHPSQSVESVKDHYHRGA